MEEKQIIYYSPQDELDEELTIDLKKIFFVLWSRKFLIAKVFISVLIFFILMTFILPKKFKVDADLYINKSNSSNMAEINPYFISEIGSGSGMAAMLAGGGNLTNELELMQSPLVIDKVIKENDLRVKKLFGIITTKKTGQYLTTEKFLKKSISFENKKGTNVVTIEYKSKDRELAYNVVSSIINNYVELHKELNTEKSKADKAVLEHEYNKAKADLNRKMNSVSGLPSTAMSGSGNLAAMSAFSKSAQSAISRIQGQYVAGEKSKIAVTEDAEKVAQLSSKLEWARLVDRMSDTSKVLVLKEPRRLQEYEQASPKLFTNILLGIVFGVIASLGAVIFRENFDKKLTYSMLGENVLYDLEKDFTDLQVDLLANKEKTISIVMFEKIADAMLQKLQGFKNIKFVKADISDEFLTNFSNVNDVMTIAKVGETESKFYKQVKAILAKTNKNIMKEILI